MRSFQTFVAQLRLLDLGFEGYPYTWRNKHDEGFIQECLDRVLATHNWVQDYQQAIVKHVMLEGLDHAMLVLSTVVDQSRRTKRFMCDLRWNMDPSYEEVVHDCRGGAHGVMHAHQLARNLCKVKYGLLVWRKNEGRNEQREICRLNDVIRISNRCLMVLELEV